MKNLIFTLTALIFSFSAFAAVGPITGTLAVCAGSTTTLSDTSAGGTWSTLAAGVASVSATGVVSGIAAGTAEITYTTGLGSSTAVVTVNPLPPAITGPLSLCPGSTTSFSDAVPGGTWSSSSPAIMTVSALTGLVTVLDTVSAYISYTLPTGCSAVSEVTVNRLPSIITGRNTFIPSETVVLSDITLGGTWVSSNPAVATITNTDGILTGVTPGTAIITYVISTGCFVTFSVTVYPFVAPIVGPPSVCEGSTIALTNGIGGGVWSSVNTSLATIGTDGVVTGIAPGTDTILYTTVSGVAAASITVINCTCTGTPAGGSAMASVTSLCPGYSSVLSLAGATVSTAINYQWQISADGTTWTDLSGATTDTYTYAPPVSQYYRCKLTCPSSGLTGYSSNVYINAPSIIVTHNAITMPDTVCALAHFYISICGIAPGYTVTTYFGDGTSSSEGLTSTTLSYADVYHAYSSAGNYYVKQVLYSGAAAVDSISFPYDYSYCRTLAVQFYYDNNSNCVFDAGDINNTSPISVEIDSSGVAIDTISVTSGFYYKVYGVAGAVYAIKVLTLAAGSAVSCPATGVIYDTLSAYVNIDTVKWFALPCTSSTGFDLGISSSNTSGRHTQLTNIVVTNTYCSSIAPVLTIGYNSKYNFNPTIYSSNYTDPLPTSVAGNTLTWNLDPLEAGASRLVTLYLERPTAMGWLTPGDTVHTMISVSPSVGDINPENNMIVRCDTVKSSWDPNDMAVSPEGYILPCTPLEYKVMFENTGNDTAHNVSILDTLSGNLDPSSLSIVTASAPMNISILHDGGYNIVKFDFPHINLLDTSHHNHADGMVIFNIKARTTVTDGNIIANQAGIYFDDNEVVMTNMVQNTIGIATITGLGSLCAGTADTLAHATTGGLWSASNLHASVTGGVVSGLVPGLDTISYTVLNSCASRTATKVVTINTVPVVSPIGGTTTVCAGSATVLSDALAGGTWSSDATGIASVAGGAVSGIAAGTAGITYIVANACGADSASVVVTVDPLPVAGTISGPAIICIGAPMTFTATATGGTWSTSTGGVASVGITGSVHGLSPGSTTISYTVSNSCGAVYAIQPISVSVTVHPSVGITASPGDTICTGSADIFIAVPVDGGVSPFYKWAVNGVDVITGITYSYVPADGDVVRVTMASHANCASPDTVTHAVTIVAELPLIPIVSISASPGLSVSAGEVVTLTAGVTGAGVAPAYQWIVNGAVIAGATNATYSSIFSNHDSVSCQIMSSGVCGGYSSYNSVYINVTGTGVAQLNPDAELTLYPNPATSELNIKWKYYTVGKADVIITDIAGRAVFSTVFGITAGSGNTRIDLPSLLEGIYLVTIKSNSGIVHEQVEIRK